MYIITDKGSNFCGIFTIFQREIYDWNYMNYSSILCIDTKRFVFVLFCFSLKLGLLFIVGELYSWFNSLFFNFLKFSSLLSGLRISKGQNSLEKRFTTESYFFFEKKMKKIC